jgi:putative DNA primase/helicase
LNVLEGVLGDYAKRAAMDTFTASNSEKHSTDVAALQGARLVMASETAAGKRWDEPRLKNLSGGEPVTARFMRQDNFTYIPQFKLVFIGNHKPELRDVGESMRRRIHMVLFTFKPVKEDRQLGEKLRAEYPAILAWAIRGCLDWQQRGLDAPPIVTATTADYFATEDAIRDWMSENVEQAPDAHATTEELFMSWREWANRNNEYVGSKKRFASMLIARGIPRWQEPGTRKMGFDGIRLKPRDLVL